MGNKTIPAEVVNAIELAEAAGWKVSNRNRKITITPPGHTPLTIGHGPNEQTIKEWKSSCARFNLIGQGPARTPEETEALIAKADKEGLAEAERLNKQRQAFEAKEQARRAAIEAATEKARAATQQGMTPKENASMPKTPITTRASAPLPVFDRELLGTRVSSRFLLKDGTFYCIECWEHGDRATYKAPQGLAAHRSRWHQIYNDSPLTQETSRVSLPADIDTALDMLRASIGEALGDGVSSKVLAEKEAEVADLRHQVEVLTKQVDADRAAFEERFEEAQRSNDKALKEAAGKADTARQAEIGTLMSNYMDILKRIKQAAETLSPIQAVAAIDTIVREFVGS